MKKLVILVTMALVVTCLAVGCTYEVKAYTDPEQPIDVGVDREFVILIALESNPTTGYSWQASYDETMLELVENSYEPGEYAQQGAFGAGGTEYFKFRALKKGDVVITMDYKRPWEEEIIDTKVFTVNIE